MKTITTVCALTLATLCGAASAQNSPMRTDRCARLGTFVSIAMSQVENNNVQLGNTYVYRKFAVNTPLADQLARAEAMMRAEHKSPLVVAAELQNECEKSSLRVAMLTQTAAPQSE